MILLDEARPATLEDVSLLRRTARRSLESLHIDAQLVSDIQLSIAELAANAVKHAKSPPSSIGLKLELHGLSLRLEITDDGAPFEDFEVKWAAAGTRPLAATEDSGIGLTLASATLHDVSYAPGPPNRLVGWRRLKRIRPSVLLVEDTPTLLMLYTAFLTPHYRVHAASSLEEARQVLALNAIDIVVCDYHLDDGYATTLASELEQDPERLPTPMIIISADDTPRVRSSTEAFAIEQFLRKPISQSGLLEAVDKALVVSKRRLAALLRYVGANVEKILQPPAPVDLRRLGIGCLTRTALVGGGDFVLHLNSEERDRLIVGDFMGHGLRANAGAIAFAATMRTVHALMHGAPGRYLEALSAAMRADQALSSLLATVIVVDRLPDGSIEIAGAAHPAPLLVSETGSERIELSGPLLGFLPAPVYTTNKLELGKGQRLVIVTDGVEPRFLAGGGNLPDTLLNVLQKSARLPMQVALSEIAKWGIEALGPSPRDDWSVMLIENAP